MNYFKVKIIIQDINSKNILILNWDFFFQTKTDDDCRLGVTDRYSHAMV